MTDLTTTAETPAVIYPTAEALDTIGYSRDSWRFALYLIPAGESSSGRPEITSHSGVGNIGTPMPAWHGRWASIGSYGPDVQGESVLAALRELEPLLLAASDAYLGSEWDGSNHVGRWEVETDEDGIALGCEATDALYLAWEQAAESLVTAWDAGDWYAPARVSWADICEAHGVDTERGESALAELAEHEEEVAASDGVLLSRTEDALRSLLEEHREKLAEDDDEDDDA
jgi:hypothetical protein